MSGVALSRVVGVAPAIAGRACVPELVLETKLGAPAWHTYRVLCAHRDRNGETHITQAGIRNAKTFVRALTSDQVVKRAIRRLVMARLVCNVGWRSRPVQVGRKQDIVEVFVRKVFGCRLTGAPAEYAVPIETKAWMETHQGRGGVRMGAGRKSEKSDRRGSALNSKRVDRRRSGLIAKESNPTPPPGIKPDPPIKYLSNSYVDQDGDSPSLRDVESRRRAAPVSESFGELGAVLGGASYRPLVIASPGVPPFPGISVLAPATVPPAPRLTTEQSDLTRVTLMMKAYRGAVEARYRKRCFLLSKGDLTHSKHYPALVAFAAELVATEIPPAAWCIHRVDKWRKDHGQNETRPRKRAAQPSISYVFAPRAISDELRWQFRQEYAEGKLGGAQVFSDSHRKLLQLWHSMQRDIRKGASARDAVDRHFPDGLYEELLDQAKREAAEIRFRLEDDIKRGRHVW